MPREAGRHADELDDARFPDPDWVWVGELVLAVVVGHIAGGAPFGLWEDEN